MFTFRATQDEEDDGGEKVLLAFGTPLPQGVSAGTPATTTVTITDDDTAGVSVSNTSLTIAEGSSGTYTIVLDSEPTATVTVTINDPSGNTGVTADPASLTFSSSDWSSTKTVTVRAAHDNDTDDETATVTHAVTSTDSSYSDATADSVVVTVTDDDPVQVTVMFGASTYTVAEGATVELTVTLSADPERRVVDSPHGDGPERCIPRRLLRGARELDLQRGGHVEVVHLHGHAGRHQTTTARGCCSPSARACRPG